MSFNSAGHTWILEHERQIFRVVRFIEVIRIAVSLAIDCMIDNHNSNEDIPLVITSYDDFCRRKVLDYIQEFCEAAFPDTDKYYFNPNILHINGRASEEVCINLNKLLRSTKGILFWSDAQSWFASLPDGLFHVVNINQKTVTRGLNKNNSKPTIINKEYSVDILLSELFLNGAHMEQTNANNVPEADMKFYDECHAGLIRPIDLLPDNSHRRLLAMSVDRSERTVRFDCVLLGNVASSSLN